MTARAKRGLTDFYGRTTAHGGELRIESNLFLHPGADDVIGDRHGWRRGEAVGMPAQEHGRDLLALEPAGVVEFGAVDDDLARACLGMAADHQRGGKRPRLRGEVAYAPANDA